VAEGGGRSLDIRAVEFTDGTMVKLKTYSLCDKIIYSYQLKLGGVTCPSDYA